MITRFSLIAAALLSACTLVACSNTEEGWSVERKTVDGLPSVVASQTASAEATVEAVDYANRSIALQGPSGVTQIFSVSPAVRNFSQIKKGDVVRVEYASRVAASVRKTTDPPETNMLESVELAQLGEKPGIVCTRKAQIEATVDSIDYQTRLVKLRTTSGTQLVLTADKKLKNLESVHQGDQVVFDYAEAVSIQVR